MTTTGGRLVAKMRRAEGVEVVFGIVDGSYFALGEGLQLDVDPRRRQHERQALDERADRLEREAS